MRVQANRSILLEGDGIAAVCIARLLADAGVGCVWQPNGRPKLAAILLGEQTQHLLRELFPADDAHPDDLFNSFLQINRRIVLWGEAPGPLELPHSGVVAPEAELLQRLWQRVPALEKSDGTRRDGLVWRIQTFRTGVSDRPEQVFGHRVACFATVELRARSAPDACWVESVASGWLFLLPLGGGTATLIAVGDSVESLLAKSRLAAEQVACIVDRSTPMPAFPRLTDTLSDSDVITCGGAAMSFDPLCGEGAGNAVREAFLAASVVRASIAGNSREALAEHYADRLRRGFLRHLQLCLQFYTTGGSGDFWKGESALLRTGIEALQLVLEKQPRMRFRLVDRDLMPS